MLIGINKPQMLKTVDTIVKRRIGYLLLFTVSNRMIERTGGQWCRLYVPVSDLRTGQPICIGALLQGGNTDEEGPFWPRKCIDRIKLVQI